MQKPLRFGLSQDRPATRFRWWALAALLAGATTAAVLASTAFSVGKPVEAMPITAFAGALSAMSLVLVWVVPRIMRADCVSARRKDSGLLVFIFVAGLILRLCLLASEPILEVDFNRYLWDGGMTVHGHNPYALAPAEVSQLPYNDLRLELSKSAVPVFERISYPELRTIYPPTAQAAFAFAHLLAPWSLTAWRLVCIALEAAMFPMLVALLATVGRSPLWSALYWWNPLVLKEMANSAHMEAVFMPLVVGCLLLTAAKRHVAATACLGLAIGTKVWPLLLVPLLLRPLLSRPKRLLGCLALLATILGLCALPVLAVGLEANSGFVAFAEQWATNSAHFPALVGAIDWLSGGLGSGPITSQRIARIACALLVAGVAFWLARSEPRDARDLVCRVHLLLSVLVLLSPVQFPWYVLWVLPLAVIQGGTGWLVATVTMPLYYLAFSLRYSGQSALYDSVVVWAIWLPVWAALALDWRRNRREARGQICE